MNWGEIFDPTGNNYLGAGKTGGRVLGDMPFIGTWGLGEFFRKDPWTSGGTGGHVMQGIGGAIPGGIGGFATGGYPGMAAGAATGGGLAGTGTTDNSTLSGFGENFGAGAGAGGLAGYGAGTGMFAGGSGGGASAMTPYMPTSTPVMGQAGSTLGGGMGSSLNLGTESGMGASGAGSATPSMVSKILNASRMANSAQGQGAPAAAPADILEKLYKMFPGLRPGSKLGTHANVGGTFNG